MEDELLTEVAELGKGHILHRRRQKIATALAAVVVFCTVYVLILPAITMETFCGYEAHAHSQECYDENDNLVCGMVAHAHTDDCYKEGGSDVQYSPEGNVISEPKISVSDFPNMENYAEIGIDGANTKYDPEAKNYKSDLKIAFQFEIKDLEDISFDYGLKLPEEIVVTEDMLNKEFDMIPYNGSSTDVKEIAAEVDVVKEEKTTDENGDAAEFIDKTGSDSKDKDDEECPGKYQFIENGDQGYALILSFNEEYISKTEGAKLLGCIGFEGIIKGKSRLGKGDVEVDFGEKAVLDIPGDEVDRVEGATQNCDISVTKDGKYLADDHKLAYTVYVDSVNGTPANIKLKDVLDTSGLRISALRDVTVVSGTRTYYKKDDDKPWFGERKDGKELKEGDGKKEYSYNYSYGNLDMTLPVLASEDNYDGTMTLSYYKITYEYDLVEQGLGEIVTPENAVEVTSADSDKDISVADKDASKVTVDTRFKLEKTGWYNDGKILWTTTVNGNKQNIVGALLTDDMFGEITAYSDLQISPADGYEIIYDYNKGEITGIKFIGDDDDTNTNEYKITYWTDVEPSWAGQDYSNTAVLDGDGNTATTNDTVEKTMVVNATGGGVECKYNSAKILKVGEKAEVTWTATINVPNGELPAGNSIVNNLQLSPKYGVQYMTKTQVLDFLRKVFSDPTAITPVDLMGQTQVDPSKFDLLCKGSDGRTYTYDEMMTLADDSDVTFSNISIALLDSLNIPGKTLTFQYNTTADLTRVPTGGTVDYKNYLKVGDKNCDASYTYLSGGVKGTDGNGNGGTTSASNSGYLSWKVETVIGFGQDGYTELTITDTLPDAVNLKALKLVVDSQEVDLSISEDGTISSSAGYYTVSGTYLKPVVTLSLKTYNGAPLPEGAAVVTDYNCKVEDPVIDVASKGDEKEFTNSVKVAVDGNFYGSDKQTQLWTFAKDQVLSKKGSWNKKTQQLDYSVEINPAASTLMEGSPCLTLTDVLNYDAAKNDSDRSIALDPDSVKLYYMLRDEAGALTKGQEVEDSIWGWDYSEDADKDNADSLSNIVTATIPDRTPLVLEYSYDVTLGNASDSENNPLTAANKVTMDGVDNAEAESDLSDIDWEPAADFDPDAPVEHKLTVYSVEEDHFNITLPGSKFIVYEYMGPGAFGADSEGYVKTEATYTTNDNGSFSIKRSRDSYSYKDNTLYKVVETQCPEGYLPMEEQEACYFYFSGNGNMMVDVPDSAVDLSKESGNGYMENKKNTINITVDRQWFDKDGNNVTDEKSGVIVFDLYQVANDSPDAPRLEVNYDDVNNGVDVENYVDPYKEIREVGTLYNKDTSYVLTNNNGWKLEIDELPLSTSKGDDKTVYYSYYVVPQPVVNYSVMALYSDGEEGAVIKNGEDNISIDDVAADEGEMVAYSEDYGVTLAMAEAQTTTTKLPKTGGTGMILVYIFSGILVIGAGVWFTIKKQKATASQK